MALAYVTRVERFNAAHRLHNPDKSDEWNRETFGKCNNPHGHGHNYRLEVTVAGEPDPDTGYVIDLGVLKHIIWREALDHLDHRNINVEVDFMQGILPSTENLVIAIWKRLENALPAGRLARIRLWETDNNIAEYCGE